jgi:pimeloyl-ACP methyl ester carboxylesterase
MLRVEGAALHTVEVGDGPEVVVLLHGGPGASHDYLRPQMDALGVPGRRRLFYYDQRGGGQSPLDPGRSYGSFDDHVADVEAVRQHLGGAPLRLVGYSFGALVALGYAAAHPEGVARLALVSPAPAAAAEREEMKRRLARSVERPQVGAFRRELEARGPLDRRARFALAVSGWFHDPRRALELTPFVVKQAAEGAAWRSLGDYDLRPRLDGLGVPALVAHGMEDPIPVETAERTAKALGAEWVPIEGSGHVPYVEAPELLFPPLLRFLG